MPERVCVCMRVTDGRTEDGGMGGFVCMRVLVCATLPACV